MVKHNIELIAGHLLPNNLCIPSSGTHFYSIGLSLIRPKNAQKRSRFRNPLFIFIFQTYFVFRSIYILVSPEKDLYFYRLLGDFGYVFGTRLHFNLTVSFSVSFAIASQLINYYNYKYDVNPSYMRLFDVMSGSLPPKAVGLTNNSIIRMISRRTALLVKIGDLIPLSLSLTIFLINFFSFFTNSSIEELTIYVIPNCILWFFIVNIVYSIIFWQLIYFYLIALYLKLKLKHMNDSLIFYSNNRKRKRFLNLLKITKNFNSIYCEIEDYDNNYWSKFLLFVWLTCSTIISTISFFILFGEMPFILRIFCLYFDLFYIMLLYMLIKLSSDVYNEANNSHQLLSTLNIMCNKQLLSNKIKVSFFIKNTFLLKFFAS